MPGKFELYRDMAGKYRYRLRAANGQELAAAGPYDSKRSATNAIKSLRKNAAEAEVEDHTR